MQPEHPHRDLLQSKLWETWDSLETDQKKKIPHPPAQKPFPANATLVDLKPPADLHLGQMPLTEAIHRRRSHRKFNPTPLTVEELSFLLWATQGLQKKRADGFSHFRTVPSGGARHPFETYLAVIRVGGLQTGLYRYLPLTHQLCLLRSDPDPGPKLKEACRGQGFAGRAAAVFIWAAVPYRSEWRYGILASKLIALEAGHLCQNLYLASEAIGAGTCAIGAYDQDKMDTLLGLDGKEEFAVYVAPVGKIG